MSRKGCEQPRIFTPPRRELTEDTTYGFAMIAFVINVLHETMVPWQQWLAIHALELNEDGTFRFRVVLVIISRQNGKSYFSKWLALFFMYVLGMELVLGTAQSVELAEDIWDDAVSMAERIAVLAAEIEKVTRRNGGKALRLKSGNRYKIAAATRGSARGLSCDLVLLDELREHTDWEAWSALSKTTLARPNAQIWCITNQGDERSVVLRHLRRSAHAELGDPDGILAAEGVLAAVPMLDDDDEDIDAESIGLFEWSAHDGCDIWDRDEWALANPSLGYGFLTERALASAAKTDPEAKFRTECLTQEVRAVITPPFPCGSWDAGIDDESEIDAEAPLFFGVDVTRNNDMIRTAIAVAGRRPDGAWHVEVVAHRPGIDWAKDWLAARARIEPVTVAMQGRGAPISSELADFEALDGVTVARCEGRDIGGFTGRFYDAVAAAADESESDATPVYHRTQPVLDRSATIAQKTKLGDSAFCWDRAKSVDDISPLIACTMALGLATGGTTEKRHASAYARPERALVVI